MPKRAKSSSMETCRICLCDNGVMTDIFTTELRGMIKELAESTSINIDENEGYPRSICHVCLYKLDMWCDFKAQFLRSNRILVQQLEGSELSDHIKKMRPGASLRMSPVKLDDNPIKMEISPEPSENLLDSLPTPPGMLESASETNSQRMPSPTLKPRSSNGRRTSEQRLASTQRWEARKKALLAATGENDSDTDSMASDDNQLSPIQKARAKNNAEKEAERQRRVSKACHNLQQEGSLEISATDTYLQKSSEDNSQIKLLDKTEDFVPQSVQSEIMMRDATYVVTSTLMLTDPSANQNHLMKEKGSEDLPNYQNTDIMDAVKLKRVSPLLKTTQNDKKLIERCLNIEVEGTELPTLQKVQTELAKFIEMEVKQKLMNNTPIEEKIESKPLDSGRTLEQKLKNLIERTLKKNIENSRMKRVPMSKITAGDRMNKTFSSHFIKAAMKSPLFQPKVLLRRVAIPTVEKRQNSPRKVKEKVRKTPEFLFDDTKLLVTPSRKTYSVKSSHTPNILKCSRTDSTASIKPDDSIKTPENLDLHIDNHICGICGAIFSSKAEMETHHECHTSTPSSEVKHKMMRCKRCQEIVEAKFVKTHVCKTSKYKCEICNQVFKIQSALDEHLQEHNDHQVDPHIYPDHSLPISQSAPAVVNLDGGNQGAYSCFICDKNFTNADVLKDHIQTHCDNMSEGEQAQSERVYQCAICGEIMDSESTLENHVEKHLYDDEDDNPNLINIEGLIQVQIDKHITIVQP
ncbi:uncharacterized protein [Fopius arisanus]|uniref:Uncharacterized protein n=1 Tax=Fopius arisanus TaxID=64838 RepID=A0A9R1TYM1_9HYME|nr:PREDICTED: uncharacterized protein LOC105265183 [Fopius arisanus]